MKKEGNKMFKINTERSAIEHYAQTHDVDNFVYDGLKGFVAFDMFCTDNEEFLLELIVAHLDIINDIDAQFPKLPEIV
tara:strand:- start:225 stop:458 length:234 start_codon:yes stop_codon:yes gene_type:complete